MPDEWEKLSQKKGGTNAWTGKFFGSRRTRASSTLTEDHSGEDAEEAQKFWRSLPTQNRQKRMVALIEYHRKRFLESGGETLSWEEIEELVDERRQGGK